MNSSITVEELAEFGAAERPFYPKDATIDALLMALPEGGLSAEELALLNTAAEADIDLRQMVDALTPLSSSWVAESVEALALRLDSDKPQLNPLPELGPVRLAPSKSSEFAVHRRFGRVPAAFGATLALAAGLVLFVAQSGRGDAPASSLYTLQIEGGHQEVRGAKVVAQKVIRLSRQSPLQLLLRPDTAQGADIRVSSEIDGEAIELPWQRSSSGAFRLAGTAQQFFQERVGPLRLDVALSVKGSQSPTQRFAIELELLAPDQ